MVTIQRRSPVSFAAQPRKVEERGGWNVVLAYEGEGDGPFLLDLSHKQRWDLQDAALDTVSAWGQKIPTAPGESRYRDGLLINRMNRTQASLWCLSPDEPQPPDSPAFTDVTDAAAMLALIGPNVFSIAEKFTALDLADPQKTPPFLLQGPFAHVPCQVVVLADRPDQAAVLWTCSRGYGRDMTEAVLHAGEQFGLRPAGENRLEPVLRF